MSKEIINHTVHKLLQEKCTTGTVLHVKEALHVIFVTVLLFQFSLDINYVSAVRYPSSHLEQEAAFKVIAVFRYLKLS